ncbi:MAG: NCS2 family permease [Spirochaetaceae bacterium]|jgi:AGZA family xanthine/uracil permease-like MFS transporter|nr:NCS2 family permease [Spirochaetaceae bacterium]
MEKLFKLKENGTTVSREIAAGLTTFLTMAYILAVNPGMLGSIGDGMTPEAVFTATIIASVIGMLVMAFAANLPIALAPGMGLNAFFTYTVVLGMGYSWRIALAAVFCEGIVFIILSFFNVREALVKAIPANLKYAVAVGIGLFITMIGLGNSGVMVRDEATFVALGDLTSGSALTALIGFVIMTVLYVRKVPGAILIGIIITTLAGIPLGVTVIPQNFSPLSLPAAPLLFQFDFSTLLSLKFFTVFFTFLFVDIFDTVGTLVGITTQAGLIKKDGEIPRVKQAFFADAVGTAAGAALGTSTVTSYIESASGVAAGGRTGLTAISTAALFMLSLFLSPLFLLIPGAATAPALIMVGFLMIQSVVNINFKDPTEGIPAFFTIFMMPFAYSVAQGIVFGVITYVVLKLASGKIKDISLVTFILSLIFIIQIILK